MLLRTYTIEVCSSPRRQILCLGHLAVSMSVRQDRNRPGKSVSLWGSISGALRVSGTGQGKTPLSAVAEMMLSSGSRDELAFPGWLSLLIQRKYSESGTSG